VYSVRQGNYSFAFHQTKPFHHLFQVVLPLLAKETSERQYVTGHTTRSSSPVRFAILAKQVPERTTIF